MEINASKKHLESDPSASSLVHFLQANETRLGLEKAQLYYDFPLFRDLYGAVITSKVLLVSPQHGVVAIMTANTTPHQDAAEELQKADASLDQMFSLLYSRLIRNKNLRKTKTGLGISADAIIFAPLVENLPPDLDIETKILITPKQFEDYLQGIQFTPIEPSVFIELVATIEGAKGLIRLQARNIPSQNLDSKGYIANQIEAEIASFDQRQKYGYMVGIDGLERIRGLAGSGKTVVLAMKAALTHLRNPEANILYTFYTKSLYQHIQRLITRFYRQFDDRDPDWSRLKVMHAWGGHNVEGVYFKACTTHGVQPISFTEAARMAGDPFNYVCKKLLDSVDIRPIFDYIFIDEGQDLPASFLRLCIELAQNQRVVLAYDDLQTIFQAATPTLKEIFGFNKNERSRIEEFSEDVVLYKCYRNPREILVCSHALGFGIYGSRIVQMLENKEHWEDIGYKIIDGEFVEGSAIIVERPTENSLKTISEHQPPEAIVKAMSFSTYQEEIQEVVKSIKNDLDDGLRPDDILVIVVDDLHAKKYLNDLTEALSLLGIHCNNIHTDTYGLRNFQKEGYVTLSTVHKAKGNEAFMVYVVGVDALFSSYAGVRKRNILFTAMTRAKGWVRVSGIGRGAQSFKEEIGSALRNFPYLKFKYPSPEQLKIMRRDLGEKAMRKHRAERKLDEILEEMSPEEIKRFIEQRSVRKGESIGAKTLELTEVLDE